MYGGRQLRRARGKSEIILRRVRVALPFPIETRINTGPEQATETEGEGASERDRNRAVLAVAVACTMHSLSRVPTRGRAYSVSREHRV